MPQFNGIMIAVYAIKVRIVPSLYVCYLGPCSSDSEAKNDRTSDSLTTLPARANGRR